MRKFTLSKFFDNGRSAIYETHMIVHIDHVIVPREIAARWRQNEGYLRVRVKMKADGSQRTLTPSYLKFYFCNTGEIVQEITKDYSPPIRRGVPRIKRR